MIVTPDYAEGMSMGWALFNSPTWTIRCGNCHCDFTSKIPKINYPIIPCPNCNVGNRMNLVWEQ